MLYKVKATYKYQAEDMDELAFEVGEIIQVVEYDDPEEQVKIKLNYFWAFSYTNIFRRKKSLQRNQIFEKSELSLDSSAELKLKTQPFIPELRNSLECDKIDVGEVTNEESDDNQINTDQQLVRPSEIRRFVRSNSKHKIEIK